MELLKATNTCCSEKYSNRKQLMIASNGDEKIKCERTRRNWEGFGEGFFFFFLIFFFFLNYYFLLTIKFSFFGNLVFFFCLSFVSTFFSPPLPRKGYTPNVPFLHSPLFNSGVALLFRLSFLLFCSSTLPQQENCQPARV